MATEMKLEALITANPEGFRVGARDAANAADSLAQEVAGASARMSEQFERVGTSVQELGKQFSQMRTEFSKGMGNADFGNLSSVAARAKAVFAETRTEQERLRAKLSELNELYRRGAIDEETYARGAQRVQQELARIRNEAENAANSQQRLNASDNAISGFDRMSASIGRLALQFGLLYAAMRGVSEITAAASSMEQLHVQLESIEGSAAKAKQAFDYILDFAQKTPLQVGDVTTAYIRLKNFGLDPTTGALQAASDMAARMQNPTETLTRLTLAMGQAWARSKLQGQDILQMIDAGVPVWDMLAKITGKNVQELQKLSEKGALGRDVMKALFDEMERESGGAAAAQMETLAGKVSNLEDAFTKAADTLNTVGTFEPVKRAISDLTDMVSKLQEDGTLASWASGVKEALEGVSALAADAAGAVSGMREEIARDFGAATGDTNLLRTAFQTLGVVVAEAIYAIEITVAAFGAVFRDVAAVVLTAVESLDAAFKIMSEVVGGACDVAAAYLQAFAKIAWDALHLNWSAVAADWDAGMAKVESVVRQRGQNIVNAAQSAAEGVKDAWANSGTATFDRVAGEIESRYNATVAKIMGLSAKANEAAKLPTRPGQSSSGTPSGPPHVNVGGGTGKTKKPQSRASEWEAELAEEKANFALSEQEQGRHTEFTLAKELDFWEKKLAIARKGSEEERQVRLKVANLKIAMGKEEFEGQLAELKAEQAQYKANLDAKLDLAKQYETKVAAAYGQESKQYLQAHKDVLAIQRQLGEQQQAVEEAHADAKRERLLAEVDEEEAQAKQRQELGLITEQQLLAQEQQFENRRNDIRREGLQERLRIEEMDPDRDPTKVAKLNAQLEQMESQHQKRLSDLRRQQQQEQMRSYTTMMSSIRSGFQNVFAGVLNGTMSVSDGIRSMANAVLNAVGNMLAELAAKWLTQKIQEWLLNKVTAVNEVAANAAVAGSAATASAAAIPFTGWMIAPAAGASAYAAAMGYAATIPAAANGFDVPSGVNPVTQLHQREMVLPAELADVVRGMAEGGGRYQGGMQVNISATDAQSVRRLFRNEGGALLGSLRRLGRNFRR